MCGIAGIIKKTEDGFDIAQKIAAMSRAIAHRGPDGEGFILASGNDVQPYAGEMETITGTRDLNYLPKQKLPASSRHDIAFAHRRLAIIDLSPGGHQPMCCRQGEHWITYNGEIYNYIELRAELELKGESFVSQSDTEVILAAYRTWGAACVQRFNGMWSFVILDHKKQTCFASRDRLGVKPFYYVDDDRCFAFASEQKAFIKAGLITARVTDASLAAYLVHGALERKSSNFFDGIQELMPGHNLHLDLTRFTCRTERYYSLSDSFSESNEGLGDAQLIARIAEVFRTSVQLRMRSDVPVGTCLSGGIDSSALAVTMAELNSAPLHCFTSIFSREKNNEDPYASLVASRIGAMHHKVEPDHETFMKEADELIYSQDVPIWSTSTYAQHKVMQLASGQGVKVVLDGQGADELFAGYHHHLVAKWNYLLRHGRIIELAADMNAARKSLPEPYAFYLKEKIKGRLDPSLSRSRIFLDENFAAQSSAGDGLQYRHEVNAQLQDDIERSRLKIFLKCEDRCGMWHGVESRTPFSDDLPLISTAFSFRGERKIQQGILKYLLREAVREQLPEQIYRRYDKTGFDTPMNAWVQALKYRMMEEIEACRFHFLKPGALSVFDFSNSHHIAFFFKLFVLARWYKVFRS